MTLLRILRNLAVLVILTVAALSLNPRPVAAQSSCRPLGWFCSATLKCCPGSLCGGNRCCNKPLYSMECTRSDVCCFGMYCSIFPGKSYGRCV
jgi:hypothetical protein